MTFTETRLKGAFIIQLQRNEDERGFFARTFCQNEFKARGLNPCVAQCNISYNKKKSTFRGMHFQMPPYEEDKLVSCIQGAMLDYIVDLRTDSPTFKEWIAVELTPENGRALYVPKSFAHGFITLKDDTTVHYQMSEFYQPDYASGFRFDDPTVNIELPFPITTVAQKDAAMSKIICFG
jgi:dTDP-4-dehydrorhamnose 3,5-epimerase